jgi:hypothetical protein
MIVHQNAGSVSTLLVQTKVISALNRVLLVLSAACSF